jgi:hypothetical protein
MDDEEQDTTSYNDSWDSSMIGISIPPLATNTANSTGGYTGNNNNTVTQLHQPQAQQAYAQTATNVDGSYSPTESSSSRKERKVVNAGEWLRDGKVKARRRGTPDHHADPDYTRDIGVYTQSFAPYREANIPQQQSNMGMSMQQQQQQNNMSGMSAMGMYPVVPANGSGMMQGMAPHVNQWGKS